MPTKKSACKKCQKPAAKKKIVAKKPVKKAGKAIKEKPVGKVLHYFDKIKVAVIKASLPIKVGDTLRFEGGEDTDFKQKIVSMEVDYKKVKILKKGQAAGIKIKQRVREGYKVFKA